MNILVKLFAKNAFLFYICLIVPDCVFSVNFGLSKNNTNPSESFDHYKVERDRLKFALHHFKTSLFLAGTGWAGNYLFKKYLGIEESSLIDNPYSYLITMFWAMPAILDIKRKLGSVKDLYQSDKSFATHTKNFRDYYRGAEGIRKRARIKDRLKHDENFLMVDGAFKWDAIFLGQILSLHTFGAYDTLYIPNDIKNKEIVIGMQSKKYSDFKKVVQWGNYINPKYRDYKIKQFGPQLKKQLLAKENNNSASNPFYFIGESYGGIFDINSLYYLCQDPESLKAIKQQHIVLMTNSSPYKMKDIEMVEWLLNNLPHLKVVGLLKFDDAKPNSDPFPQEQINTFFIKGLYDQCLKNNPEMAERIFIATLWREDGKDENNMPILKTLDHNDNRDIYLYIIPFLEDNFLNAKKPLGVYNFILP